MSTANSQLPLADRVDLGEFLGGELPAARGHVLVDLLGPGGARDHAADVREAREPADGQVDMVLPRAPAKASSLPSVS